MLGSPPRTSRSLFGAVTAVAAGFYVAVQVTMPVLNPSLDVMAAHPEDYANGPFGFVVNLSYAALAVALGVLAVILFPGVRPSALAPALLLPPAALCLALAVAPPSVARSGEAVSYAVLGLAVGPLAISLAMPRRVRAPWRADLWLAAAVLVAFAGLVAAPGSMGGLVNRVFDVLAGAYVALAGLVATRGRSSDG
jgi:hypothetical protein